MARVRLDQLLNVRKKVGLAHLRSKGFCHLFTSNHQQSLKNICYLFSMDLKRAFSKDEEILDTSTPLGAELSAKYSRSYAYFTVNSRLPVILTKVIDHLAREKEQIVKDYGDGAVDELKEIIGSFSKLKNELQTNKIFLPLTSNGADVELWNKHLEDRKAIEPDGPRWYSTVWLYSECYMYRRFREAFELSGSLNAMDPFRAQKEASFNDALKACSALGDHLLAVIEKQNGMTASQTKEELILLLTMNLWGNSCDLSVSLCESSETSNFLHRIEELQNNVLANESEKICNFLTEKMNDDGHVAIICDNVGYELFTDLCIADFLITFSLAKHVKFHLKAMPWFVSDVMPCDFTWNLKQLAKFPGGLANLAARWQAYVDAGTWTIAAELFWTLPLNFDAISDVDKELFAELTRAKLVIVKGDLNYRKLVGGINWDPTTSFHKALGKFHPTSVAALRTVKCDLICGLQPNQAEACEKIDPNWMRTGDFGVIQFDGQ